LIKDVISDNVVDEEGACVLVRTHEEIDHHLGEVAAAAEALAVHLRRADRLPLDLLRALKFEAIGRHPIDGHALNAVEQVNQTWTYLAALHATRKLLEWHPEAEGFSLAPGAHAAQDLDIMSVVPGLVGAETFAAVHPRNNNKLKADLRKLATRPEQHRYVFFVSPAFPDTCRQVALETDSVRVWSLHVD
jgi:hypothetical protein